MATAEPLTHGTATPSSADHPDLDWSQIRETVIMLNLAIARIQHAMKEGSDSVATLTDSFTSMVSSVQTIEAATEDLPEGTPRSTIEDNCGRINQRMHSAIVAFQFYDRLSQRLQHCSSSLTALGDLISEQNKLYNPYEWKSLRERVRSHFTLDSDQKLLQLVLDGKSIDSALAEIRTTEDSADDVELF